MLLTRRVMFVFQKNGWILQKIPLSFNTDALNMLSKYCKSFQHMKVFFCAPCEGQKYSKKDKCLGGGTISSVKSD